MPVLHCIAVDCASDSRKDEPVRFYQLPKVASQRKKWLNAVRREGLIEKIETKLKENPVADIRHLVLCSKHFVDSGPSVENPLPVLFNYNSFKQATTRKTCNSQQGRTGQICETSIAEPIPKKLKLVKCTEEKTRVCYPYVAGEVEYGGTTDTSVNSDQEQLHIDANDEHLLDHSYTSGDPSRKYCQQTDLLEKISSLEVICADLTEENRRLRTENAKLKSGVSQLKESFVNKVLKNDENVKHFLGLPSLVFLSTFLVYLSNFYDKVSFWKGAGKSGEKKWQTNQQKKPGQKRKLSMKEEFVLVMLKLRLGLDNLTLSVFFYISVGQVSSLFSSWINFLAQVLEPVIKWPSRQKLRKHMPLCFKLKYPNTTSIIDCTEVFIQKPKNCTAQASTWSNYKTHNTLKSLVAIQPNGAFTFVSKFWSGNISDRKITINSKKYLDKIMPGDEVMADRGFQIRDLLTSKGAYLNMPPFTSVRKKGCGRMLTSKQIIQTRRIASLRIHVERAIRRLKCFKLLGNVLPLTMKELSSSILRVAAAFCNFLPPLVKKFK